MKRFYLAFLLACMITAPLSALVIYGHEMVGRIDLGPAYARIDILESGKTVKRLEMAAIRTDATIVVSQTYGLCLKPTFLYGRGAHSELITGSIGIGFCIPYKNFTFTPYAGCQWTQLSTNVHVNVPVFPTMGSEVQSELDSASPPSLSFVSVKTQERFRSASPFIAFEATYDFWDCWRVCGLVQYAWSHTNIRFKHLLDDKSRSRGPNYSAMLERDINDNWSINIGAAYNITLSHEKHGLRGMGVKLGTAYWF